MSTKRMPLCKVYYSQITKVYLNWYHLYVVANKLVHAISGHGSLGFVRSAIEKQEA